MPQMSSGFFFFLMVACGAAAIYANTQYPRARSREAQEQLAKDARMILLPEIEENYQLVTILLAELNTKKNEIPLQELHVSAWETVSKGGLLQGLPPLEITKLLAIYDRTYRANKMHSKYLDLSTGVASALKRAGHIKGVYRQNLINALGAVQSAIHDFKEEHVNLYNCSTS